MNCRKLLLTLTAGCAAAWNFAGDFTLESSGTQTRIGYRGAPLVESLTTRVMEDGDFAPDVQSAEVKLPDGGKAYNLWSANPDSCFRQETAISGDGSRVEFSILTYNEAGKGYPGKSWELVLPFALFDGAEFDAYMVNGRSATKQSGKLSASMPDGPIDKRAFRFFAVKKGDMELIFDLMPLGPGDYFNNWQKNAIRGVWSIAKRGDKLVISQKTSLPATGSFVGGKLVIRCGTFADYGKLHALTWFHYGMKFPAQHQFSFGAAQTGEIYTHADAAAFDAAKGYGWLDAAGLNASTQNPEGAYYSHLAGKDKAFRITGLPDGVYVVTVGAGNFDGAENNFSVTLNGKPMTAQAVSAKKGEALVLTQALWVTGGTLDVNFKGSFLVSTISTQFLQAAPEDYSFRRAFFASKGFDPAPLLRSEDWKPASDTFPCHEAHIELPEPGKECAGELRMPARPVLLPAADDPEMTWRYNANVLGLGGYTSSDWRDEKALAGRLAELKKDNVNAVMGGILFSPHCYPNALPRDMEAHAKQVKAVHDAGLKYMEHHDTTLLWNMGRGFNVMCERIAETEHDVQTGLPNPRFCFRNREFKAKYFEFAKSLARMGIDAFQLDEVYFFDRGCTCADCRRAFHEETGWYLPMNELDKSFADKNSPLRKAWFNWKLITEANWFVELRGELQKINPHLCFSLYTTHLGFTRSLTRNNSSFDLEEHARAIDFFGTEVMTRNPLASGRALVPLRKAFNIFNFAYGAPVWSIFYNSHFDVRYFAYALSNMNKQQALIAYLPAPAGRRDYRPFAANPDNMDRLQAHAMAEVALLFPHSSRDWNSTVSFEPELFGLAQTLEEIHVPYQVIGEVSLNAETLKQFKVLSIGSAGCLSDEQVKVIKQFAADGGTVLLADIAGVFDATGKRRDTWAFADVFGFSTRVTPAKNIQEVTAADGSKIELNRPVYYWPPKPVCKDPCNWTVQVGSNVLPVWIERKVGKGRMIYQPMQMAGLLYATEGAVGKKWNFKRNDALAELMHKVLAERLAGARLWTTDAPEKVYTTLYREPDRILVHFLNGIGTSLLGKDEVMTDKVGENNFPPIPGDVHFTLEKTPFKSVKVYAVSPDFDGRQALEFKLDGEQLSVTLPKALLNVYTIVIIEKEK